MSNDSCHRSRHRRLIQVELLESRALLSANSASSTERYLLITPSSQYVNQQQGSFTVTLTLTQAQLVGHVVAAGGHTPAALDEPVTVDFSASLEGTSAGPTPAASPFFAPFNEPVTFPAGVSTETVTVPIISTAATTGSETISLSATTTSSSVTTIVPANSRGGLPTALLTWVDLYSTPDAVPPTITGVQLVTHGQRASAVVLDFSKPMDPATVENIHNYRILSPPTTIQHGGGFEFSFQDGPGSYQSTTTEYRSFPIAAATYDPSTNAVTLTLKRPVTASKLYQVSSAYPLRGHILLDLQGQPLLQGSSTATTKFTGGFSVGVRGVIAPTPWAPGALKSTTGGVQNWFSG